MNKQFIFMIGFATFISVPAQAGLITRPNTYTAGDVIRSNDVNTNETTIYDEFNGNIGTANILDGSITGSDIANNTITATKLDPNMTPTFSSATVLNLQTSTITFSNGTKQIAATKLVNFAVFTVNSDSSTASASYGVSSISKVYVPTLSSSTIIVCVNTLARGGAPGNTSEVSIGKNGGVITGGAIYLVSGTIAPSVQISGCAYEENTTTTSRTYQVLFRISSGSTLSLGDGTAQNMFIYEYAP